MDNTSEHKSEVEVTLSTIPDSFGCSQSDGLKAQIQENNHSQDYQIIDKKILLEDSTLEKLPNYVENLLYILDADKRNEAELLIALIYCIALESGFAVEDCFNDKNNSNNSNNNNNNNNINNSNNETIHPSFFYGTTFNKKFTEICSRNSPQIFHDDENTLNHYKIQLKLFNYSNYKYYLIAIRTGEFLVVTFTNNNEPGRSWCLSIPRYVLSKRSTKNLPSLFRNLPELSVLMKEHIFGPVRNFILAEANNLFPGLTGLPVELSHFILTNLNLKDLQNLSKTCWKLRCICVDYYELKHKPKIKPYGSKDTMTTTDSSSAFFRNFF